MFNNQQNLSKTGSKLNLNSSKLKLLDSFGYLDNLDVQNCPKLTKTQH